MQIIHPELPFYLVMVVFLLIVVFLLLLILMHPFMPKKIVEKYFKPPHFTKVECEFFSGFPFAPVRSLMFMRVIAFPDSGKKRNISGARELSAPWYVLVSYFIVAGIIALNVIVVSAVVIYLAYKVVNLF